MARSIVRHAFAALAAVVLAACAEATLSSLHVEITPDKPSYAAGETATITVRNVGDQAVGYNLCPHILQKLTGSGWVSVDEPLVACTMELISLPPGGTTADEVPIPTRMVAGTYRVYFPGLGPVRSDQVSADLQTRQSSTPFKVTD